VSRGDGGAGRRGGWGGAKGRGRGRWPRRHHRDPVRRIGAEGGVGAKEHVVREGARGQEDGRGPGPRILEML